MQKIPEPVQTPLRNKINFANRIGKGFRKRKGDCPIDYEFDIKVKKENKQKNYTNPDPWARLVGRSNTAPVYIDGKPTTGLLDTGAQLSLISRDFCKEHNIPIQSLSTLVGCDSVNGTEVQYEGYAEVNFQVPGRDFNEDHLFLVVPPINYHKQVPVIIGTYILDRLVDHLKDLDAQTFESLDTSWKLMHKTRLEAHRLAALYKDEPSLGKIRTTKAEVVPAHGVRIISGHAKIDHGGYCVNAMAEKSSTHPLPVGLKYKDSYRGLTAGSSRVPVHIENTTDHAIVIPNRYVIADLHLANEIPRLIFPGIPDEGEKDSDLDSDSEAEVNNDSDPTELLVNLEDKDEGITFEKAQAFKVLCEDIGMDMEADGIHVHSAQVKPETDNSTDVDDEHWILDKIDLTGLEEYSKADQDFAKEVMLKYSNLFSKHDLDMGRTNLVKHNIILSDPLPFKERYRRIPPQMYEEVKAHLKEMLDLGAIRPSHSPWASAIVLVRKKDGKLRFCIDLRKLNQRTIKDSYSLPRIEQVLDSLVGAQIFSSLDLKAGYWQVEMVEECKPYTAFTCGPMGFYECETMPFGATNAPATFQRLMENCLGELNMNWCIVYLDDIIIFSKDPRSHIERLEAVFKKLQAAGLKLNPKKCSFFKKKISYLGHVVSAEGVATDPKKLEAVKNWPIPFTVYDVRSFLGFIGYYRKFIKDFSKIAKPLRTLLQGLESQGKKTAKKSLIDWTSEHQETFDHLKQLCCEAPILAYPDHKLPFILHTDSSTDGLGAILYQVQGGQKRVIAYASRSVNQAEARYPAHKLEFLALKWAITEKFHDYLYGGNVFDVYTDNNPLTYILTSAKLDACGQRWVARLASYNFNLHYKAGSSNVDADALSRIAWPKVLVDSNEEVIVGAPVINAVLLSKDMNHGYLETLSCNPTVFADCQKDCDVDNSMNLRNLQLQDKSLNEIIYLIENKKLRHRKVKKYDTKAMKRLLKIKSQLVLKQGVLYRKTYLDNSRTREVLCQFLVPQHLVTRVLQGCHDQMGHQGKDRTLNLLRERFFWPRMFKVTEEYIAGCTKCLKRKAKPHVAPLKPILVSKPMELVHMDFLSIEPSKGNIENVLVITDHFTRYAQAFPSKTQTAKATAKILWENFIVHYGFPESFISDQGRNFESELISELCAIAGVDKVHTTPYHPMTNGMCERFNATLCNMLGTLDENHKEDWKSHLGTMTHAYNCTSHVSTTYSPYFLMFGRHPRIPLDVELGLSRNDLGDPNSKTKFVQKLQERLRFAYAKASEQSSKQAKQYKKSYDKRVRGQALSTNDLVLVKVVAWKGRHKIQNKWEEDEYYVMDQPNADIPVYRVKCVNGGKERVLHRNLLLPLGSKYQDDIDEDSELESDPEEEHSEIVEISSPSIPKEKVLEDKKVHSETPAVGKQSDDVVQESVGNALDSKVELDDLSSKSDLAFASDMTLDPKYLVPMDDESSIDDSTQTTRLKTVSGSETNPLMDTQEFLEFVDEIGKEPDDEKNKEETVSITESQFSSVMSYHEGDDSSWLTNTKTKTMRSMGSVEDDSPESKDSVEPAFDDIDLTDTAPEQGDNETQLEANEISSDPTPPVVRRSTRRNLGVPPVRYGDPRVHGVVVSTENQSWFSRVSNQLSNTLTQMYEDIFEEN